MKRVLIVLAVFACVVVIFMSGFIAGSVLQLGYFAHLSKNFTAPAQSNSANTNYTTQTGENHMPQNYGDIVPNRMLPDVPAACCTIWRSSSRSKCAV